MNLVSRQNLFISLPLLNKSRYMHFQSCHTHNGCFCTFNLHYVFPNNNYICIYKHYNIKLIFDCTANVIMYSEFVIYFKVYILLIIYIFLSLLLNRGNLDNLKEIIIKVHPSIFLAILKTQVNIIAYTSIICTRLQVMQTYLVKCYVMFQNQTLQVKVCKILSKKSFGEYDQSILPM